ncbi:hypothetical protein M0802_016441 [Mischocyttarus mexicanus]|nr:hypothetical protein M0802_016441 [Mischocyttarus mexicanus]
MSQEQQTETVTANIQGVLIPRDSRVDESLKTVLPFFMYMYMFGRYELGFRDKADLSQLMPSSNSNSNSNSNSTTTTNTYHQCKYQHQQQQQQQHKQHHL